MQQNATSTLSAITGHSRGQVPFMILSSCLPGKVMCGLCTVYSIIESFLQNTTGLIYDQFYKTNDVTQLCNAPPMVSSLRPLQIF